MARNNKDFHEGREHIMDYTVNPNTGKVHEVIQKGDGMSAPAYTRLAPIKNGPDVDMPDYADHYEERNT
jgi:hypothetical protein